MTTTAAVKTPSLKTVELSRLIARPKGWEYQEEINQWVGRVIEAAQTQLDEAYSLHEIAAALATDEDRAKGHIPSVSHLRNIANGRPGSNVGAVTAKRFKLRVRKFFIGEEFANGKPPQVR
jgi:hypothetical protein